MPALSHSLIDAFTSFLTGSINPTSPINVRECRSLSSYSSPGFTTPSHIAITLYPPDANSSFCFNIFSLSIFTLFFPLNEYEQKSIITSVEPFAVQ